MKIAFSLRNELNGEKVRLGINKLVDKYLKEGNSTENGIITIEIVSVREEEGVKNLEINA